MDIGRHAFPKWTAAFTGMSYGANSGFSLCAQLNNKYQLQRATTLSHQVLCFTLFWNGAFLRAKIFIKFLRGHLGGMCL